jgi:ribonucleotide monophosphatase NagD (HAD superfamily)
MLESFASLVAGYRVIFFDAYGVLKNARGVMQGVPELLSWILRQGKDVFVITNDASRSPAQMASAYTHPEHGVLIPASRNISSGLLAKDFLRSKVRAGKVA